MARRRARAAGLAAAALAGCLAVAACGSLQLGAAAIVGGQAISTATLTTQVADLSGSYHGAGKVALDFPASQFPQQVLSWLIRFAIRDDLARREHIRVTAADIQRAISALSQQARSGGASSLAELAIVNGLPPDLINPQLGTYQAIASEFIARLDRGRPPSSAAGQQALDQRFSHAECLTAKSLDIKVNPQFGRLDYSDYGVVAVPSMLSAPGRGAATPSSSPASAEFRPPC